MNSAGKISASIMCANWLNIGGDLIELEKAGVDYLHIDIMDGHFVPNITIGFDLCRQMAHVSDIKRDIHLLMDKPGQFIADFCIGKGEMLSVHAEANPDYETISRYVRKQGALFGVALDPETGIEILEKHLDSIDFIVVMMIKPGFAGLPMENGMVDKITSVRKYLDKKGFKNIFIEVDGHVGFTNAGDMRKAGADIFVAGTSSVFNPKNSISNGVERLRETVK